LGVFRFVDVYVPTAIPIPIPLAPIADIWRLVFMTAVHDKWLESFAMACAAMTFPAKCLTTAKAVRADVPTRTLRRFNASMFGLGGALFFVATGLDLFGYSRRILAYDSRYL